jgi:hypothetical protein
MVQPRTPDPNPLGRDHRRAGPARLGKWVKPIQDKKNQPLKEDGNQPTTPVQEEDATTKPHNYFTPSSQLPTTAARARLQSGLPDPKPEPETAAHEPDAAYEPDTMAAYTRPGPDFRICGQFLVKRTNQHHTG